VGSQLLINFLGRDRDSLDLAVSRAREVLSSTPGATDVDTTNKNDGTQFTLSIDRAKLAQVVSLLLSWPPLCALQFQARRLPRSRAASATSISMSFSSYSTYSDPHDASHTTLDSIRQIPVLSPPAAQSSSSVLTEA